MTQPVHKHDDPIGPTDQSADSPCLTRAQFLKRAAIGGGGLAIGGALLSELPRLDAARAPSRAQDVRILNFLLIAEHLQVEFYTRALDAGNLTGELLEFAETVAGHEADHVEYLTRVVGDEADEPPSFTIPEDTLSADGFGAAALILEENASAAYIGQGANLTEDNLLAAARIVSVEARHAAWMRDILGKLPAPAAADKAKTPAQVTKALRRAGFTA